MRVVGIASTIVIAEALLAPPQVASRGSARRVSYLSEVEEEGKSKKPVKEVPSDPRDHSGVITESVNEGPANYDGFIDADGFDGGDGQVGVVGDGKNAMEVFDMDASVQKSGRAQRIVKDNAIGGSESKKTAKNVWGYSTGYAEELKKRGMVEIDEYGEDRLEKRRQQLENFQVQQQLRLQKEGQMAELESLQGKEWKAQRHGSYIAGFEKKEGVEVDKLVGATSREAVEDDFVPGDKIYGSYRLAARVDGRDGVTISVDNEFSTFSDFKAGFTADSDDCFYVEPIEGTLNKRGSAPTEFVVKFLPTTNKVTHFSGTFIVKTEDNTWTYELSGRLN